MYGFIVVLSVFLFLVFYIVMTCNAIQKLRTVSNNSFAQLDMQLKYRQEVAENLMLILQKNPIENTILIDDLNSILMLAKNLQTKADHSPDNNSHIVDYVIIQDKLTNTLHELCDRMSIESDDFSDDVLEAVGNLEQVKGRIERTKKTYNQWVEELNNEIDAFPKTFTLFKNVNKKKFKQIKLIV